jgi:DNA ligase (NAD+)
LHQFLAATPEELNDIEGIGEVVAKSISDYLADESHVKQVARMQEHGVVVESAAAVAIGPLTGSTFLFTGTLSSMSRTEAGERVKKFGAEVADTVNKKVTHVVVGADAGSKEEKAKKMGIPRLTEGEFLAILEKL